MKERSHCQQLVKRVDVLLAARWGGSGIVGADCEASVLAWPAAAVK